jgi:hypothetical protein
MAGSDMICFVFERSETWLNSGSTGHSHARKIKMGTLRGLEGEHLLHASRPEMSLISEVARIAPSANISIKRKTVTHILMGVVSE